MLKKYQGHADEIAKGILRKYEGNTKGLLRRYKGNTKEILRKYKGNTKEVQREYKGIVKGMQRKCKGNTKGIQREYKGNTMEISNAPPSGPEKYHIYIYGRVGRLSASRGSQKMSSGTNHTWVSCTHH